MIISVKVCEAVCIASALIGMCIGYGLGWCDRRDKDYNDNDEWD